MTRRFVPIGLAVAAAVAVPATAHADGPAANRLILAVSTAEGTRSVATLRCGPAGGTHPAAAKACAAIARARGDLTRLPARAGFCTMQYAPVTATAAGRWAGQRVWYRRTFGNACELALTTGPVFAF